MDDPEPVVLDPSQRDPCFVLRELRQRLPAGTEALEPEQVLGCVVGPDDPEPEVLDPSLRDPCFVLRELRERLRAHLALNHTLLCDDGTVAHPRVYMPCLRNQQLTLNTVTVRNYAGERVICQHACDENLTTVVVSSLFTNIPGTALWASGLEHYDVHDTHFCPCGGLTTECVYLNAHHGPAEGREFHFYNNRHCGTRDVLPTLCEYDISPELRCKSGSMQCLAIGEPDECLSAESGAREARKELASRCTAHPGGACPGNRG